MTRADLVLWMLVYPWATTLAGLLAALAGYVVARPVAVRGCNALRIEAWRIYAILAIVPAFFVGAEAMLWGRLLAWRAPFVYTGLPWAVGLWLVVLAPVPALALWTWRSRASDGGLDDDGPPPPKRALGLAAALLGAGAILMVGSEGLRERAWTALAADARSQAGPPADRPAVDTLVRLSAHRYVAWAELQPVLDEVVPTAADALAVAHRAGGLLDSHLSGYFADRIEAGLASGETSDPAATGPAIGMLWSLTGDPRRTIEAYAVTVPALRAGGQEDREQQSGDLQPAAVHALRYAPPVVVATIVQALDADSTLPALSPDLIDALMAHVDDDAPTGPTAVALLLRDGSPAALRPILPRFVDAAGAKADYEGPIWRALRDRCIQRAAALPGLAADGDARVAAGAREVLAYVRQYCRRARPIG